MKTPLLSAIKLLTEHGALALAMALVLLLVPTVVYIALAAGINATAPWSRLAAPASLPNPMPNH